MAIKKFTTSAQKTLTLPKEVILQMLEDEITQDPQIIFENTKIENIKKAKLKNGSELVIASFDKEDGKTLAMIDLKNISNDLDRKKIQTELKNKLEKIF